jgi:hypothetical protein
MGYFMKKVWIWSFLFPYLNKRPSLFLISLNISPKARLKKLSAILIE